MIGRNKKTEIMVNIETPHVDPETLNFQHMDGCHVDLLVLQLYMLYEAVV